MNPPNPVIIPGLVAAPGATLQKEIIAAPEGGWKFTVCVVPQAEEAPTLLRLLRLALDGQVMADVRQADLAAWLTKETVPAGDSYTLVAPANDERVRAYRGDSFFMLIYQREADVFRPEFVIRQPINPLVLED